MIDGRFDLRQERDRVLMKESDEEQIAAALELLPALVALATTEAWRDAHRLARVGMPARAFGEKLDEPLRSWWRAKLSAAAKALAAMPIVQTVSGMLSAAGASLGVARRAEEAGKMPTDPYELAMGYRIPEEEELRATAGALRGRNTFGQALQMTGLEAAQGLGKNVAAGAQHEADQVGDQRMRMELQAQRKREDLRSAAAAGDDYHKMSVSDRKDLVASGRTLGVMQESFDTFKGDFTQQLLPGPQSRLPNLMAQYGVGTEKMKEGAEWWAKWNRFYRAGERNALFGATLTENEQRDWNANDINPSMSEDQIRRRMGNLKRIIENTIRAKAQGMKVGGFNPQEIDEYTGLGEKPIVESGNVETKTIGDRTFIKKDGQWYEQ